MPSETRERVAQSHLESLPPHELRERRRALRLTQAELGERLGVSTNTVARWERGELRVRHPRQVTRTLERLERTSSSNMTHSASARFDKHHDLAAEHPDTSILRRARHNLPAELSSFVGREHELTAVADRLRTVRLLTLVGPGGVGKTRLAQQVASRGLAVYSDGVWLVELAPLADSSSVANLVAATLGIRERGRTPLDRLLVESLRDQHVLLVLDNCEHLLDGCAELVHTLLRECRGTTILATSREPLRVLGETRWHVPPLSLEKAFGQDSEPSEAVKLFIERAHEVQADVDQSEESRQLLASICLRLDGLPLAIELAAARTGSIPVRALQHQLQSTTGGLPVLIDGPRDAPARQQTLRATIAWSYDLLTAEERALFRRLAPFRGCTTEAVEAVCIGDVARPGQTSVAVPPLNITADAGLASLVTRNLVQVEDDSQGHAWYSMLETVREFALDRLEASPESGAVWRRYAWYYARLVEQSEPRTRALRQDAFLDRLEREHANVRSAMDWCQAHGYAEASLRLGVGLFWFWTVRGYMIDGRARLEALLARFPLRSMGDARAHVHAEALDAVGHMAAAQSDFVAGTEFEQQALAIYEHLDDADGAISALDALAVIARKQNDLEGATRYLQRILDRLRDSNAITADAPTLALALANLGTVAHERGDAVAAATYFEEALQLIEAVGDTFGKGLVTLNIAGLAQERGDYHRARTLAESALQLLEREHDQRGVALALAHLGSMAVARREYADAYDHLSRSLRLNMDMGDRHGLAFVLDRFAVFALMTAQPKRALRLAGAANGLREQGGLLPNAFEQHYIDQQIEPARRHLGRMADWAVSAGRVLSLAEATSEALAVMSPRPSDSVARAEDQLSARECQVAMLVALGYTNRRIAARLIVSEATAATHVRNVLSKLQLRSRAQLAVWATRHGLLDEQAVS